MDPDTPIAGYYLARKVRNGPLLPVHIWFGVTPDPDFPDNPMDRSPVWHAVHDGQEVDIFTIWPWCGRNPITEADYRCRMDQAAWDRRYDPRAPRPDKPIDINSTKPVF